jgi:hypothetical protein
MSNSAEDAELLVYAIGAAKEANVRIPNAGVETDRVQADRIFQLIDKATIGFFELKYWERLRSASPWPTIRSSPLPESGIKWKNPEGQLVETCSITSTPPNTLCAEVHDRMPFILPDEAYDLWLDPGFQMTDAACDSLARCEAKPLTDSMVWAEHGCAEY